MIAPIVWLIFLVIIIAAVIKNGKRNTNRQGSANRKYADTMHRPQTGSIPREKREQPGTSYSHPVSGYRETAGSKSTSDRKSVSGNRKNTAAHPTQNNVNSAGTSRERQMNMEDIYDKNNIVAAAKANARKVELDNDFDASQAKLMEGVYDVMVKGPNDTISFQRDFLAEGLDMLNSFQIGNEL